MNFDKLKSELKEALLKLDDEIKKNTKIKDDNIKLKDENKKLNHTLESILKLNEFRNGMILFKKNQFDEIENIEKEIKRLNEDSKNLSEEIENLKKGTKNQSDENENLEKEIKKQSDQINRIYKVLKIQKKININFQNQIIKKTKNEKNELIQKNKKLLEEYDKILSSFDN